jgi:murein DD-endopeptidase MepM/ murein hydrolase activator NlpD
VKRLERRRAERIRRSAATVGLSFALGALADDLLEWRLGERERQHAEVVTSAAIADPALSTAEPRIAGRRSGSGPPVATAGEVTRESGIEILRDRELEFPVANVDAKNLRDTFFDARGQGRAHEALDIIAPRGTPVRAVEDGTVVKLFDSPGGGGLTVYQFDPSQTFCYYYAHLDAYAPELREGQAVRRGQTIGYVGSTGNASPDAPHLHFAIFQLTPERQWWKGDPINPYPVFK